MTERRAQVAHHPKIAVIGGGYSGIASAVRIIELGGIPTVYESAAILGGRARRIEYAGRVLDNGQHILSGAYTELLRLMDLVGVSARDCERVPLALNMPPHFSLRAALLPAPLHMAYALLCAHGLSWRDRLAAIRFMSALKKANFVVPEEMTVASLLQRHRQTERVTTYLWQPLTISALNTPLESASAQVFANVLRDALAGEREASDLLLPKVDLTALFPEPAARWISANRGEIATSTRITHLEQTGDMVRVDTKDASQSFDAAVIAVGPHQRDVLRQEGTWRENTHSFEPIVTIYFGFQCHESLPTPMLGQAHGTVQWFFDRRALFQSDKNGELVISAVISASGPHEQMPHETLSQIALGELRGHIPNLPDPIWQKIITEKFATFACSPGANRLPPNTALSRVWLAGDDIENPDRQYPATLEGAVRNGIRAAELAFASCRTDAPAQAFLPPTDHSTQ